MPQTPHLQTVSGGQVRVVRRVADLRGLIADWRGQGETVGLVPTMGALHEGHLSLVRQAKAEHRRAVATLFVNPFQFGLAEDFLTYPRNETADIGLLAETACDVLFAPDIAEMYPKGFATAVTVGGGLTDGLCGPFRPGHFAGVATVVTKLLLQALPDSAYFGEKDYQQLQVIRRCVRDLNIPVTITGVPTLRDADDLALSSRNRYLSATERELAVHFPRVLKRIAARLADGTRATAGEIAWGRAELQRHGFLRIDYLDVCDAETLQPLEWIDRPARVFGAAWLGRTRLIDNWPVPPVAALN